MISPNKKRNKTKDNILLRSKNISGGSMNTDYLREYVTAHPAVSTSQQVLPRGLHWPGCDLSNVVQTDVDVDREATLDSNFPGGLSMQLQESACAAGLCLAPRSFGMEQVLCSAIIYNARAAYPGTHPKAPLYAV